ncbi:hypothetical protein NM688_g3097 [Phlebia brevispora]|uniref:Uncharacterized protein n=1 Tax=Phlebia brevispora TaxID=194682 RepID=A0ACC1T6T0_9APHY|nr:hypothetical protein NM688_g3097 [Phlebia brevispora]
MTALRYQVPSLCCSRYKPTLPQELSDISNRPLEGLNVEAQDDNIFVWKCTIKAASNSPYKGGTFHFTLTLPPDFPFKAPTVVFNTKIYHPGINDEGHICVPWKPSVSLSSVLATIQDKLNNPSPDDPFEPDIAALMKTDQHKFLATAKEWTKKFPTVFQSTPSTGLAYSHNDQNSLERRAILTEMHAGVTYGDYTKVGWASANIRATFDALKAAGHNVLMVAPAIQESGHGGTFVLPTTNIVPPGGEFGSIPVGAPFFGHDVHNPDLFYFNGTPAACVVFGLDILVPQHFGKESLDLVVSGPNEGLNAGPFLYTISGTIGATYAAVERGVPAIALSAGNGTHRSFTTNTGLPNDPANIVAQLTTNFVQALANGVDTKKDRLLPLGLGIKWVVPAHLHPLTELMYISINMPTFGPGSNCTDPPFILTRMTPHATIDKISLNPKTGFPETSDINTDALNVVLNGVPILPDETTVSAGCSSAFSVFSIDYDAPTAAAQPVQLQLLPLVGKSKLT